MYNSGLAKINYTHRMFKVERTIESFWFFPFQENIAHKGEAPKDTV